MIMLILLITERRGREGDKTEETQVTHNTTAHHPLADVQPVPELQSTPLPASTAHLIYWIWCFIIWNSPLACSGQLSWPCSALASCGAPYWHSKRHWEVLDLGWALLSNNQNITVLPTLFSQWIWNTGLYQLLRKQTLSQTKPWHWLKEKLRFLDLVFASSYPKTVKVISFLGTAISPLTCCLVALASRLPKEFSLFHLMFIQWPSS